MKWYRKAAVQGHPGAQYLLGVLYCDGRGVAEDYIKSYAWLSLSAALGNEEAKKHLDTLSGSMTPEQVAEAKKVADKLFDRMKK